MAKKPTPVAPQINKLEVARVMVVVCSYQLSTTLEGETISLIDEQHRVDPFYVSHTFSSTERDIMEQELQDLGSEAVTKIYQHYSALNGRDNPYRSYRIRNIELLDRDNQINELT